MKVLHVQKVAGIGGSERHLLDLLPSLRDRGMDVRMCVLAGKGHAPFTQGLRESHIETTAVPMTNDVSVSVIPTLMKQVEDYRPDLVHTHLVHADVYGQLAAQIKGIPSLASFHSSNPFYRKHMVAAVTRFAYRKARAVIAISRHVASFLDELALVEPSKVRTVPYGIATAAWQRDEESRQRLRASFGMDERVAIGVASRLFPNKGHDVLIRAFRDVVDVENCCLFVAGDGVLRAELEALSTVALPTQSYRYLGYVGDIVGFMNACDIMVFPTQQGFGEGFGLAALEAMAAARPVVASRIDSLPEVVVDGVSGLLVEPGDVSALAAALSALVKDPVLRKKMGNEGRRRAESGFSLQRMSDSIMAIYEEIL